nr:hypothetical protein CFP56_67392 [Quercus suber]
MFAPDRDKALGMPHSARKKLIIIIKDDIAVARAHSAYFGGMILTSSAHQSSFSPTTNNRIATLLSPHYCRRRLHNQQEHLADCHLSSSIFTSSC